jgi:hypothetical protein
MMRNREADSVARGVDADAGSEPASGICGPCRKGRAELDRIVVDYDGIVFASAGERAQAAARGAYGDVPVRIVGDPVAGCQAVRFEVNRIGVSIDIVVTNSLNKWMT